MSSTLDRPAFFDPAGNKKNCCGQNEENEAEISNTVEYETHQLTATYYRLSEDFTTTLMLNNKGAVPLLARPTIYSKSGARLDLAAINVPAASYIDVDVNQILSGAAPEFREGSLRIDYVGAAYQMGAQVRMVNTASGVIWAEQLIYTSHFSSNRLESVWWLPSSNVATRLVVSNTTNAPVTVTLSVDGTAPQQSSPTQVVLNPFETRVLSIMADLVGAPNGAMDNKGGVSITHSGDPGAVLSRMYVAEQGNGYSAAFPFVDPANTLSQKWHGSGLRLKNLDGTVLTPLVIARNTSGQTARIRGKIPYTRPNGEMAVVDIPQMQIAPNSTNAINLQNFIGAANVPASVKHAGIELTYDTPTGTVLTQVQSVSTDRNHVFQVPMFDPQKTPTSAGGYPWKADGDFRTILYIKNETNEPKKFKASMSWDGGGYSLGVKVIKRNQTLAIDFRELRDDQIPDVSGNVIPLNLELGQIAWSSATPGEKALSGRSEQISEEYGLVSTYDCRNQCDDVFDDGWIDPVGWLSSVGEISNFGAWQQDVNAYGQVLPPYPAGGVNWSSNATAVSDIDQQGLATAMSPGTATIEASWQAFRQVGEVGSPECVYEPIIVIRESSGGVVQPMVASISASVASTKNPVTQATPLLGNFSSTVTSVAFPTETSSELMVVFQNSSEPITVKAEGINPSTAGTLVRWKIDRNPADTVASGTPSLSAQTGPQITLTPSTAGSFRLISYFDTNENGSYDSGEESRVLLLAIVRISILAEECTIDSPMVTFTGGPDGKNPGTFGATAGLLPMAMSCEFLVQGGGSNQRVGMNQIHFGNVGNLTADTAKVIYATAGTGTESPGGSLPMVDTINVTTGNSPTGGNSAFRGSSSDASTNSSSGGKEWVVTSADNPNFGPARVNHPNNNNIWATTQGGYDFTEFIVGYSDTFPKTYVVLSKANWTIRFIGTRDASGEWMNNGSSVTLQGTNQTSANFTLTVSSGSPQIGTLAGIQVLGLSYVNQHIFVYAP